MPGAVTGDGAVLERNLRALSRGSPAAVRAIREAGPSEGLSLSIAPDGLLTGTLGGRQLASLRRPREEAERLAGAVDIERAGVVVVLGFGLGHHAREIALKMGRKGIVVVFEPDAGMLRAVLERADHAEWLERTNTALITDATDGASISSIIAGAEAMVALGVRTVEHAPSTARLAGSSGDFLRSLTTVVRATRTNLVTAMVQIETTLRNLVGNIARYAEAPGVLELEGKGTGLAAIVVAAGPSLRRAIPLLRDPTVRERFVIIAVQTVLRPLLEAGIRPHFVTALDYAALSARFYEGLAPADVEGIELIFDAKGSPAIPEAFPGVVRVAKDDVLDGILGPDLARPKGSLRAGATVAHLAYYGARHLGCDPVILVGQDLGFTDGQYYHAGASIHTVWSGELNGFNSLEALEWQRIARARRTLVRATDVRGRPIYSDEQMATYLAHFERDFLADGMRGLTTIDASGGGVLKQHTTVMPLDAALARYASRTPFALPRAPSDRAPLPAGALDARLALVRDEVGHVGRLSRETSALLDEMVRHADDPARVDGLVRRVHALRDRVQSHRTGYALVHLLNQTGALKRLRADRDLDLAPDLDPRERQRRQIERDRTNVSWLGAAADALLRILDDPDAPPAPEPEAGAPAPSPRIGALIHADHDRGALGNARDLDDVTIGGAPSLEIVARTLLDCPGVSAVAVSSSDPRRARRLLGTTAENPRVVILASPAPSVRARAVGVSRAMAPECWRGTPGNTCVWDEVYDPRAALAAADATGADALLVAGADWPLLRAPQCRRIVARFLENPSANALCFAHAPPGLAPCLVSRRLVDELADSAPGVGLFASIGALLGYVPVAPNPDPIARASCVTVDPALRDCRVRFIADSRARLAAARSLHGEPDGALALAPAGPARSLIVSLGAPRVDPARIEHEIDSMCAACDDWTIGFEGPCDPLLEPGLPGFIALARARGAVAVHVRTGAALARASGADVVSLGADIISVDLLADDAPTYAALTGRDEYGSLLAGVETLLGARREEDGVALPWIVPRITRCDRVYEQIEGFHDRWLMRAGACAIDPLPGPLDPAACAGEIEPLPVPGAASAKMSAAVRRVVVPARPARSTFGARAEPAGAAG